MAGMPYPPMKLFAGCVGMAGMPYPPMLWEGVRVWAASQKTCRNSFADGVIAVRLADWARMTATLTLYKEYDALYTFCFRPHRRNVSN